MTGQGVRERSKKPGFRLLVIISLFSCYPLYSSDQNYDITIFRRQKGIRNVQMCHGSKSINHGKEEGLNFVSSTRASQ